MLGMLTGINYGIQEARGVRMEPHFGRQGAQRARGTG